MSGVHEAAKGLPPLPLHGQQGRKTGGDGVRVLLVEDEASIAEALAAVLRRNHYSVDTACEGAYGLDCARSGIYDAVILDVMLPEMDGLSVLRALRGEGSAVSVLLLTARDAPGDKVAGLDAGADDYLAKPFHAEELMARLRALARRPPRLQQGGVLRLGDTALHPEALLLCCGAARCQLPLKEAQLLELLLRRPGRTVSKEDIIQRLWGFDTDAEDGRVETHVSLLRKTLRRAGSGASIRTVRGVGYVLEAGMSGPAHV